MIYRHMYRPVYRYRTNPDIAPPPPSPTDPSPAPTEDKKSKTGTRVLIGAGVVGLLLAIAVGMKK